MDIFGPIEKDFGVDDDEVVADSKEEEPVVLESEGKILLDDASQFSGNMLHSTQMTNISSNILNQPTNVNTQHGVSPRHEVITKNTLVYSENASVTCNPATSGMASSTTTTLPIATPSTTLTLTPLIPCHQKS